VGSDPRRNNLSGDSHPVELILLNGTLHTVTALRTDAQGGFHVTLHANLAVMSGIGTTSGLVYRVTDTAGDFGGRVNAYFPPGSAVPRTVTQSGDVRFISEGSGANLLIRSTFHITIDAPATSPSASRSSRRAAPADRRNRTVRTGPGDAPRAPSRPAGDGCNRSATGSGSIGVWRILQRATVRRSVAFRTWADRGGGR